MPSAAQYKTRRMRVGKVIAMSLLTGKRIAILVENGFEQVEMTEPRKALEDAGAGTDIISPAKGKVRGWKMTDWGESFDVDVPLDQTDAEDYDALVLPGGVANPDKLRMNAHFCKLANRSRPSAMAHGH